MCRKTAKGVEPRDRRVTTGPCASLCNRISYVFSSVPSDGPLCDRVTNSEIFEQGIILKILTRSSMPLYKDTSAIPFRPVCGMER